MSFLTKAAAIAAAAAVPLATPAAAQQAAAQQANAAPAAATTPPRLLVAIAIDQFSADVFAQYRQTFSGGLARLARGVVFPSGYQSHAATETCPGHSTILTGARPSRTGIIANNWIDQSVPRAKKVVYCAEDETKTAADPRDYVASVAHLLVPTLGDMMKAANPAARNVAVSGKDRGALMMGGHAIDQVYWWKGSGFATLDGRTPTAAATAHNAGLAKAISAGAPAYALPEWCGPRERAVTAGPATVGTGRFAMKPGDAGAFRASPRLDRATLDLAARLVDEQKLGADAVTDILSVSLSATDVVGHATGTEGTEMCIQLHELDAALGSFFAGLDKRGIDYAVVLTADHGGFDLPERLGQQALPQVQRADPALLPDALGAAVGQRLGIPGEGLLLADGPFGDFWIKRDLAPEQKARVLAEAKALLLAHPQVAAVFPGAELAASPRPATSPEAWTLLERAAASYNPAHSGDFVVLLKRGVVPIPAPGPSYVATHGSPWDYDRRVPILFWRKGLTPFEQPSAVETVDIAPTLAALIGLNAPEGTFDGRCLDLDAGPASTCGAAR